jgi:aspartyl-tRNA(Asn)/glutamyl-tRNA(Gln) amidotransferase subunit A
MMPLTPDAPVHRLADAIKSTELSVRELVDAALERIEGRNATLNAFTVVLHESARQAADRADVDIKAGRHRGPLHGIPISIKDLIDVDGVPTTAASHVTDRSPARGDAPVVARLRDAGAILVGKCNLHEFAFGTTGEDSAFGPTRHPLDVTRSPGGSSSGSTVSVADGMVPASVGTDTGGSIRIPAAACGLVGLKPTFGELPCDGIVPLAPSLDHVGPLTRCVTDAQLMFAAMRGRTTIPGTREITRSLGCPRPYFLDILDTEVRVVFEQALERLRAAAWTVDSSPIRYARDAATVCLHIVLSEAAAVHAASLERQGGAYSEGVRLRLELGRYVLAEDYARAQRGRAVLTAAVDDVLADRDALVLPSLAIPASPLGVETVDIDGRPTSLRNVMLRLTQLFNATGHPAVSIPCGRTATGLPVGLQLVGRRDQTDQLLAVAAACETALAGG